MKNKAHKKVEENSVSFKKGDLVKLVKSVRFQERNRGGIGIFVSRMPKGAKAKIVVQLTNNPLVIVRFEGRYSSGPMPVPSFYFVKI